MRTRASEQPCKAREQDRMTRKRSPCNTHYQAKIRGQPIACSQDGRTKFIAACAAMTTLKLSEQWTGNAAFHR